MSDRKTRPVSIEGTIKCADGEEVKFLITGDGGWQQWGNVNEVLYRTSPLMDALAPAAMDFLPSDYEPDDEDEEEEEDYPNADFAEGVTDTYNSNRDI